MAGDDVISWSSLEGLEKTMGKPAAEAFARRLLGFLDEKVGELEKAFAGSDNDFLLHCIHKTASNAAALGALQLTQMARGLEADCHAGRWEHVKSQSQPLISLARQSLDALHARLG